MKALRHSADDHPAGKAVHESGQHSCEKATAASMAIVRVVGGISVAEQEIVVDAYHTTEMEGMQANEGGILRGLRDQGGLVEKIFSR